MARSNVVRWLPQTASLFAAIGLPVNLRSLVFANVTSERETHDGVEVLLQVHTFGETIRRHEHPSLETAKLEHALLAFIWR